MNSTTTKLTEAYTKLKHAEWNNLKHEAPEGLNHIGELTDDVFILYHLRVYLRLKSFPKMFANLKGNWTPEHFAILLQLIDLRRDRVSRSPLLYAYLKVYEIIELPSDDVKNPLRLNDLLRFLRTHREDIPREDWVDLCSYISNYSTAASNRGQLEYVPISLVALLHQIEHKYGDGWTKKSLPLPSTIFRNVVKLALQASAEFVWNTLEIDRVPTTESFRTVYDWLRLFIKAYRSRLVESERMFCLNFAKAQIAFHQRDYITADKWLTKIERVEMEIFNLDIYTMRLMVLYGLATDPKVSKGAYVKRFNDNVDGEVKKFERVINHLATKKEKYPPVIMDHYRYWLTAYSALRSIYYDLEIRGKAAGNPVARAKLVHKKRKALPIGYKDIIHPRKTWIEEEMEILAVSG